MNRLLEAARALDRDDELRGFRDLFWIPPFGDKTGQAYFCGHSLGLQPRSATAAVENEMRAWREQAVAGHFRGDPAWMDLGDSLAAGMADLVGAHADEVTVMNTLTVNLHLLMVSFYRPAGRRRKIVIESGAFPSDRYAVASQLRFHGFDPAECMVELAPEPGSRLIEESRVASWLSRNGDEVALVLWPGVQYASGQAFDLEQIAAAGRAAGAHVGFDLAHAAGNLPMRLHDSGADFAAWCTYKYLNGGPGAVAACFVHRRHTDGETLPRFEGWWGNARDSRFRMAPQFAAAAGAEAWQLSNPPILSMAPLRASLDIFREAGLDRLRDKSLAMTGWLADGIEAHLDDVLEVLTPKDAERRGCQLSLRVPAGREQGRRLFRHLEEHGVIADWREPDIVRVAPVPLYNSYQDCFELLRLAGEWAAALR